MPDFFHSKFCRSKKGCEDQQVKQFNGEAGSHRYRVCLSGEACSLKSVSPVKVEQS